MLDGGYCGSHSSSLAGYYGSSGSIAHQRSYSSSGGSYTYDPVEWSCPNQQQLANSASSVVLNSYQARKREILVGVVRSLFFSF